MMRQEISLDEGVPGENHSTSALGAHSSSEISKTPPKGSWLLGALKKAWSAWLKFATVLGTIQMLVILTVIYWTLLPIIAIPFKFLSDPLTLRRSNRGGWVQRSPVSHTIETMRKQG